MRFISAAIAGVVSLVLLLAAGIYLAVQGNETSITASGAYTSQSNYAVLPSEVLTANAGAQNIVITGNGTMHVMVGRTDDVAGWLGNAQHADLMLSEDGKSLATVEQGTQPDTQSPTGSDLWLDEVEGTGEVRLDTDLPPGYAVLISSDQGPALTNATITWPLSHRAPWAGPLLTAAGIVALCALALLAWALLGRRAERRQLATATGGPVPVKASPVTTDTATLHELREDADEESLGEAASSDDVRDEAESAPRETGTAPHSDERWRSDAHAVSADPADEEPDDLASTGGEDDLAELTSSEADEDVIGVEEAETAPADEAPDEADVEADVAVDAAAEVAEDSADTPDLTNEDVAAAHGAAIEEPLPASVEAVEDSADLAAPAEETSEDSTGDASQTDAKRDDDHDTTPPAPAQDEEAKWRRPRGRNRSKAPQRIFSLAPLLLAGSLILTGCSAEMWPESLGGAEENPQPSASSAVEQALINEGAPTPALGQEQLNRILDDVRRAAKEGDEKKDTKALESRFAGIALVQRQMMYQATLHDPQQPMPAAFPSGSAVYSVPVASKSWPRAVVTVIKPDDAKLLPRAVTLVQQSAREPFKVTSIVELTPKAKLPDAAPLTVGAKTLDEVAGGLSIAPDQLAAAYGDVVLQGDKSPHAARFDLANDSLLPQIGEQYRSAQTQSIDANASSIDFKNRPSKDAPVGVASLDGGAVVAVTLEEIETITAKNNRATIKVTGVTAALAGKSTSQKGFEKVYSDQLLFYVPPASSGGKVQLLGYAQTLTSAGELP